MTRWTYEEVVDQSKAEVSIQLAKVVPPLQALLDSFPDYVDISSPDSDARLVYDKAKAALAKAKLLILPQHKRP